MASEISVRLNGDNSGFKSMLDRSLQDATRFGGQITGQVSGKMAGLNAIGATLAAALGLNLKEIANQVARWVTGMSEEEEKAFNDLAVESDKLADTTKRNIRAAMTEEQRYQADLAERDAILRKIGESDMKTTTQILAVKKLEIQAAEKGAEIAAYEAKQREAAAKKAEEAAKAAATAREKEYQAALDALNTDQRIASLKDSIAFLQAAITSGVLTTKNAEELTAAVTERQIQLKQEESKKAKEIAEAQEAAAKEHIADQDKLQQLKFAALTLDQQVVKLEREHQQITSALNKAKAAGTDTTKLELSYIESGNKLAELRGQQEKANAVSLMDQVTQLEKQGVSTEQIVATLVSRGAKEQDVLAILEAQRRQLEEQEAVIVRINSKGGSYEDKTTVALEGIRDRLKSQLDAVKAKNAISPRAQRDPTEFALQQEFDNISRELSARKNVGNFFNQFGEDATRFRYGDTLTDRALRSLQDEQTKTRVTIEQILDRMKQSPFFENH